jgi:hypothetical protein
LNADVGDRAWDGSTYNVDQDGCEDGARNSLAILGIINTASKLFVTTSVESGDNAKNNNGEDGENGAGSLMLVLP